MWCAVRMRGAACPVRCRAVPVAVPWWLGCVECDCRERETREWSLESFEREKAETDHGHRHGHAMDTTAISVS